jgi:hypothetical protein
VCRKCSGTESREKRSYECANRVRQGIAG